MKTFFTFLFTALFAASAVAGDPGPELSNATPAVAHKYHGGCYAGLGAGTEFINSNVEGVLDVSQSGYVVEGQLGCQYQWHNNIVFGVFGSYGISNADGTVFGYEVERDSYYNLGAKVGYGIGRFMPYLGVSYEWAEVGGDIPFQDTNHFRAHLGADYRLNRYWAIGLDLSASIDPSEEKFSGYEVDTTDVRGLASIKYFFNSSY